MNRRRRLSVPKSLVVVVLVATAGAATVTACDQQSSEGEYTSCYPGADSGPDTECPAEPAGNECPPGCYIETV